MKKVRFKITSESPMLQHAATMANPLHPLKKEYKKESHKNLLKYQELIREILKRALHEYEQLALF